MNQSAPQIPIRANFPELKVICSDCNLRELCLPTGLSSYEFDRVDQLIDKRRRIHQGEMLYRSGDRFNALYAVRSGFFKTTLGSDDGKEQVTGFQMAGELIGLDGIYSQSHNCNAIALEDAEVCIIPYNQLEDLSRELPTLQQHMHQVMSREIVANQSMMMMLGSMRAEERLAAFLLNLAKRLGARGFSQSEFILRMTREEMGSFLGLKLETISRTFSKLAADGLIDVKQRHIKILNSTALTKIATGQPPCH